MNLSQRAPQIIQKAIVVKKMNINVLTASKMISSNIFQPSPLMLSPHEEVKKLSFNLRNKRDMHIFRITKHILEHRICQLGRKTFIKIALKCLVAVEGERGRPLFPFTAEKCLAKG